MCNLQVEWGVPWRLPGSSEGVGKCRERAGENGSLAPPDLMPFQLRGVIGSGLAVPGMATKCHPQLILEAKAAQN